MSEASNLIQTTSAAHCQNITCRNVCIACRRSPPPPPRVTLDVIMPWAGYCVAVGLEYGCTK